MKLRIALAAAAALLIGAPAAANDSTAETAAGGLVLTKTDAIDMVSEDLFVSAVEVRVRYVFRNRTASDVTTLVAFPMPDRVLTGEYFSDVAFPADFATTVDGRPVVSKVERKALVKGVDHTATLTNLGIPITEPAREFSIGGALDKLAPADKERLEKLGLAGGDEYDQGDGKGMQRHLVPLWTVKETWFWEQTFPAGRDLLVEHKYTPGTGGSVSTALSDAQFRGSPEGKAMIADYCVDAAFLAGVERMAKEAGGGDYPVIEEQRVSYILTTGGNWRSPIGDFRLVVDKGAPENLVSFCGTDVRKITPTQFEMRRKNWRPDRDLKVLILQPHQPGD